ncbi:MULTISPECIES: MATE family efflux transporter [unclassified Bradyrhizobium]|uniref:MATE family efflux transporter n=1 Tax=unclassified Bradyrhizobium TaxID=2631580 RepID=UPI0024792D4D|nr:MULTISPECIES: MATE family efflux transporter [unclassified Bradyrhizobium]WGR70138.1 MATE family efflux transporter [Bradyrhizobium sp. ISRA426]WGR82195.1 MATE family efflux transporter [Bradyrhizobium sp. ISRA430]WGR85381.1 MATE family efflux transporter [Bradyrhizobium sp. ISRA432]
MSVEDAAAPALSAAQSPVRATAPLREAPPAQSASARRRAALLAAPILPTLIKLALPTVAVLVAQTAVNIAEAYYVGFLGTDALAGAALVFPIFMLMTMMSNGGFGSGVASSVARAVGAGRRDDADAALFHAVVLAVVAGALFTFGAIVGGPRLYSLLGGQDGALAAAITYSDYLFAGAIPVWIVNLQAAALRGSGNVKVPALVTLIGAIVTIPVSPVLIFGFGPFPRLGIGGAGVAFGLYYGAAMLVLLRYMASGQSGLTLRIVRLRAAIFADMLKVGIPTALNAVLTNLTVILVTGAVGLFGTSALAGYGISSRLDYIMIPLLFGISTATLTMVGVNMGAGQTARARKIGWISGVLGMIMTGTIGITVAIFPTGWLHLFSHEAEVVRAGTVYLRIVAPAYAALGFGFVASFAAQGTGRAMGPLASSVARILIAAGGGWIAVASFGAGMAGVAGMVTVSLLTYAVICALIMLSPSTWRPE